MIPLLLWANCTNTHTHTHTYIAKFNQPIKLQLIESLAKVKRTLMSDATCVWLDRTLLSSSSLDSIAKLQSLNGGSWLTKYKSDKAHTHTERERHENKPYKTFAEQQSCDSRVSGRRLVCLIFISTFLLSLFFFVVRSWPQS